MALLFSPASYRDTIHQWQLERDAKLRKPDSWLTLVGLYWLKLGVNTVGSGTQNDLVLPKGSAAEHAGEFRLEGDRISFRGADGTSREVSYDEEKPDPVRSGTTILMVIKRGDRFAIRAKDSASPVLKNFRGLKYFPTAPAFRFEAKFIPDPKKIPILNILGQTEMQESPGLVEFSYRGHAYQLRPIVEDNTLFFLFKDSTNKTQTYQAGRMLNTPMPENNKVDLDFNRAYNPPCTFTPYATCPLPPKQNTLPFAVEAGELRYGDHAEREIVEAPEP